MACIPSRGKRKVYVTGVLILHRINDAPLSQTAHRVNSMLKCLCGNTAMNNVMIGTTMWDRVSEDEGNEHFDKLLETGAWKEMIDNGAGTAAIPSEASNAKKEAEKIVTQLIKNMPVELAIQDEMINQKLTVEKTSAGKVFDVHHRGLQAETERELKELRDRLRDERDANAAKRQEEIRVLEEEVAKLTARAKEQARERQAQVDHLRQERKKAKRDMKDRMNLLRKESEAAVAMVQKELRRREKEVALLRQRGETDPERLKGEADDIERLQARLRDVQRTGKDKLKAAIKAHEEQVRELKMQVEEHMWASKAEAKQQQEERKIAAQAMRETRDAARKEAMAKAAEAKEETLASAKPQRAPGLFGFSGLF